MTAARSLALVAIALAMNTNVAGFKRPKRREWRTMSAPHVYPPSPFESRQVRRARQRREASS